MISTTSVLSLVVEEVKRAYKRLQVPRRAPCSRRAQNSLVKYTQRVNEAPLSEKKPRPENSCQMRENDLQVQKRDTGAESNSGGTEDDEEILTQPSCAESVKVNRLNPNMVFREHDVFSRKITDIAVRILDEAIVYHQSDKIVSARRRVEDFFQILSKSHAHCFKDPTKYDLDVLKRGRKRFLEEGVSCSIKHGTLLLDSSSSGAQLKDGTLVLDSITSGAQFYSGLLNVLAAFALLISEFEIAQNTFHLLLQLHHQSKTTSRLQDLGAAHNNMGCVHLIMGDFLKAEKAFKTSLEKFCHSESSSTETKVFAVNSNMSRLNLISKKYCEALEQQEKLVKICQATERKDVPYPFEVVFTVMNNQAVLHTTLGDFNRAENALKWLITYCKEMNRKDSVYLVTFLRLHLSEVLLLHGKPEEADEVFSIETLNSLDDVVDKFGNLYMNVRIEALEKLLAVYICKGKIKTALKLLQTSIKVLKSVFGEDHFNVAFLLYKQGKILSLAGEFPSAAAKFKSSSQILQQIFGVKNHLLLKCYLYLGDVTSILGQKDESYVYYQRVAESIEAIFQVSFVEELSVKYMEIIGGNKTFQRQRVPEDGIEGLVAEYGHVMAVLLNHNSNSHLRKSIADGKEITVKKTTGLCSISRSTLSLKYSLDFLKSGRKLLRYGMIKEAVVFFQQADMHCGVHAIQGYPDVSVARLHNIFLRKKFKCQETLKLRRNLRDFTKALGKVIQERSSESIVEETSGATPTMESDQNLDLKFVLISLLILCIELKMIETTFEAYDLYCKLFQNETDSPILLLDGTQVYASRTVITCNGKTALQDILIFFETGLNASDVEGDAADTQLFRSLAYMENAPRNAFLVASKSPVFLDVDDLHSLKEKITLAVQECFQRTCFEAENKSHAMQVILDLTPTATCGLQDSLCTDSRIDLLPLCLSKLPSNGVPHKETIFEIETSMVERNTKMTFKDEQTSCFMFRKVALNLLRQSDTERFSSIVLPSHSFSLTVLHPGKARLVISRSEKSITQKIHFVTTRTTIAKYKVPSVTLCETNHTWNHGWKGTERSSQVYKGETDVPSEGEDRQKQTEEKLLECLMTVSYISRLLYSVESPVTHDDICLADPDQCYNAHESLEAQKCISREDKVSLVDLDDDDTRCLAASFQSQEDQENTSSTLQHLTESSEGNENNKLTLNFPNANTGETSTSNHGDESMPREDVCEILEGKRLFEDDRKSRRFLMADLQKSLRDKQQNQLNSNIGDSIQSNRADPYDVSKLQSSHMQNGSNCGNLEVPHQNPEAQEPNPIPTSRNVSTQENSHRISSLEGKTAKEHDKLMKKHPSPRSPAPNNVGDRNDFEEVSSPLPKTTLEKETPLLASNKSDGSSLLERKTYAENVETARNDGCSSTQNTIKTNWQTPTRNQEVQDTLRVDEEEERQAKPSIDNFKSRKQHSGKGSERIEVEITGYGTTTPENQETPRPDYDDKATLKAFGSVAGEVLPVGSMNNDTSGSQNNVVDLLNETNTVDGPILQEEYGMQSTKKRELTIHSKSKATISICNETTTRFLRQGSDVTDSESLKDLAVDESVLAKHSDKDNLDFVFIPNHEVEDAIGVDREGQTQTKPDVSKLGIRKQDLEGRERSGVEITRKTTDTLEKQGTSCSDHNEMTTERTYEALGSNQSNVVDFPRQTDFVDGPRSKEENGTQSLNQDSRAIEPISSYGQIHVKSQATISNHYETSIRSICQGGAVVADGESSEDNLNNFDTVDGPALTQNPHKALNAGDRFLANMKHKDVSSCRENESHTGRDALCEWRYPLKSKTDFFQSHSGDGGARPKQRSTDNAKCPLPWPSVTNPVSAYCDFELERPALDPVFMARHVKESSPFPSFHYGGNYDHSSLDGPRQEDYEQEYSSSDAHNQVLKGKGQNSPDRKEFIPHDITHKCNMSVPVYNASVTKNFSFNHVAPPDGNEKESWHFPSSESWEDRVPRSQCFAEWTNESNPTSLPKSFNANREKLFNTCGSVCAYNDMDSMANEYSSRIANDECGQSLPFSENEHSSTEHSLASSFRRLQEIMNKTIRLVVSSATGAGETQPANQSVEKAGVQEETGNLGEGELAVTQQVNETNTQVGSTPSNETTIETERQPMATPVQESPRPVCSHYQRRCLVRFPCCGKFFPCHRCHNESDCSEDQARAINATHIRCTICYHEQEIDENGQRCGGCNAIMSEYFCPTCRHYTSVDKNPFHCEKCGICRIHRDRSFHCDVCNVCLDKRLEGKHKCRPDSGHDECCICLEDAFSGCQILPCSHKVHKDCAIAMIQNGVRKCPICRHPLFGELQTSSQN